MGPHSGECGNYAQRNPETEGFLLQWGRTLESAEMTMLFRIRFAAWKASMGPHSGECGNRPTKRGRVRKRLLQWGRTLESAEISET